MELAALGWIVVILASLMLVVGIVIVHIIEWHLYITARNERDRLSQTMDVMTADRDGWRGVAERALLVAQISKAVAVRASIVTTVATERSDLPLS